MKYLIINIFGIIDGFLIYCVVKLYYLKKEIYNELEDKNKIKNAEKWLKNIN